jgi:hypothetical protein
MNKLVIFNYLISGSMLAHSSILCPVDVHISRMANKRPWKVRVKIGAGRIKQCNLDSWMGQDCEEVRKTLSFSAFMKEMMESCILWLRPF